MAFVPTATIAILLLIATADCLSCYDCETSDISRDCQLRFPSEKPPIVQCSAKTYLGLFPSGEEPTGIEATADSDMPDESTYQCLSIRNGNYIYRNCVQGEREAVEAYCDRVHQTNESFVCAACLGDKCNASSGLFTSPFLTMFTIIASVLSK